MTPPPVTPAPDDFNFLTELRTSEEIWVERATEAEALAASIANSKSPIVVLLGPPRAGKSELLRRWVMPVLSRRFRVSYRDSCDSKEGEDGNRAEIVFWDSFERCLTEDRIASGDVVAGLTRLMQQGGKVVLCVADEFLSRLFQLCDVVPQVRGEVLQIPLLGGERVVQTLQQTAGRYEIKLGESFIQALAVDLNMRPTTATIGAELVAVLVFQLQRTVPKHRELLKEDYVTAGGLNGLLESHLDFVFERMPDDLDSPLGWSVIEDIVATGSGAPLNLDDVARRFGVTPDTPLRVVKYLEERPRVLREGGSNHSLAPVQIVAAIEGRMRREALASEPVRAALYQGARSFAASQALLSRQSFKRIHAQRTAIKVNDEEAALLLRCALAYDDPQLPGAIDYWLQRIIARPVRSEVLFEALFDAEDGIRQGAMRRLVGVTEPEIRNQVHLLALRDPSPDVRSAAVEVLASFKDEDLKRALLREIDESTSRFRLQAIEALRVFTDADATDALVDIIRKNAPDEDVDARLKAIEVLGAQNTTQATGALLDIALKDTDADDRAGAANALGSLTDEGLLAPILERLRQLRHDAGRQQSPSSAGALALTVGHTVLAVLVVGLSGYIHGLPLFVIKRWRLGLALLAGEAAGTFLASSWPAEDWGLMIFATSFSLGLLIPTGILLRERLDFTPQSSFRRCLAAVSFAACAVTFFLVLHGLASILAKRARRGLVLFGFEVLGIIFLLSAAFLKGQFAGTMIGTSGSLFASLGVIGLTVLAVSYLIGIVTVLLEVFVHRDRHVAVQRIDDIWRRLLKSPVPSAIVVRSLTGESQDSARWAREVSNRFGEQMQEPLRQQWLGADREKQQRIFGVLANRRDRGTVEFLHTAAPSLGRGARLRAFWADMASRFSGLPAPVLIAAALVLYALVTIPIGVFGMLRAHPDQLVKVAHGDVSKGLFPWSASPPSEAERRKAVSDLQQLAQQTEDSGLALTAANKLVDLSRIVILPAAQRPEMSEALRGDILDAVGLIAQTSENHEVRDVTAAALPGPLGADISEAQRERVLEAIVVAARRSDRPVDLVMSVAGLLYSAQTEAKAIGALRRIGSPDSALVLANFARDQTDAVIGATANNQPSAVANAAARSALEALKGVEESGEPTVRLLTALGGRLRPSASGQLNAADQLLQEAAQTALQLDALSRAQYYFTEGLYDQAVAAGTAAQQTSVNTTSTDAEKAVEEARRLRAKEILQRAYVNRGTRLLDKGDAQTAMADEEAARKNLNAALDVGLSTAPAELVNLGLRLAYQLHEIRSAQDPGAYKLNYDLLTRLVPLARGDVLATVRENLAEACMTAGHYDDAIAKSQAEAALPRTDASITLALKYVQFASFILKGERPRADAALADLKSFQSALPNDFFNTWSYAGTRKYVERDVPDSVRPILLEVLNGIESEGERP